MLGLHDIFQYEYVKNHTKLIRYVVFANIAHVI